MDFDHHRPEYSENNTKTWADMRSRCPVAWSPHHGGFWAVSSYAGLRSGLQDRELCSNEKFDEDGNAVGGLAIPVPEGPREIPDEVDPPEWEFYRRLLAPPFAPAAVAKMEPKVEGFATEVINSVIETGRADFINNISSPVTALITLDILGLPVADWEFYAEPIHRFSSGGGTDGSEIVDLIYGRLREEIAARRERPGTGLLDDLLATRRDGQPLPDDKVLDTLWNLIVGGFDTTSALLGWTVYYLDEHREHHAMLVEDQRALQIATEEFLRWASPVSALARTARVPRTLEGQEIQPGDRMLFLYGSANRDPEVFDDPETVDLARFPNQHFAFGTGIHRCLGSNLARLIFRVVLRQFLTRMPDFSVDRAAAQPYPVRSSSNGWVSLPVTFTPGERRPTGYAYLAQHL
ncbi:cytochrome P450 [Actinomadura sp. LOL_016]|uniref:cytochrome P450 n=1 Tax=unclassified Actinomadura TaxID=2626254 RepID=UPI003A80716D